jgi:hypothetical protein
MIALSFSGGNRWGKKGLTPLLEGGVKKGFSPTLRAAGGKRYKWGWGYPVYINLTSSYKSYTISPLLKTA